MLTLVKRRLKRSAKLLLSALVLCGINSCGSTPVDLNVSVCLINAPRGGCDCVGPDGNVFLLSFSECDKYVSFSPSDAEKINSEIIRLKQALEACEGS